MKSFCLFLSAIIITTACLSSASAQELNKKNSKLTGILALDASSVHYPADSVKQRNLNLNIPGKKNRWLAGLFSLILPGGGEYYAGSYLKGAIFTVVEAAAITTALIYNHKGDSQTNFFQNYADQNWYVAKYAYWTLNNAKNLNPDVNPDDYSGVFRGVDWHNINPNGSDAYWLGLKKDVDWTVLNQLESAMSGGYTHQLVYPGEQQYYELIGKYPQYSHGWATANINDTDYHILTQQFLWYAHQRGLANEYYKTGSFGVGVIYVNHFLSALDAIWTTDRYNDSLALKFRMEPGNYSDNFTFVPTLHISFNF